MRRSSLFRLLLLLAFGGSAGSAAAQPIEFGSSDDPREAVARLWWKNQSYLTLFGGPSAITQFRALAGFNATIAGSRVLAELENSIRTGIEGPYRPDFDEPYDLLRSIRFVRYRAATPPSFYLRIGPIERVRLGTGHLVNFYRTTTAWQERTVGIESMWRSRALSVAAFADNLLLDGVAGGRVGVRPLAAHPALPLRTLELGGTLVHDFGGRQGAARRLTAYGADARADLLSFLDIHLSPFASYAWYRDHGTGLFFGGDLFSPNLVEAARFRLRIGLQYYDREFVPGYFGSLYQVSHRGARVVNTDAYYAIPSRIEYEGVPLAASLGGSALVNELRVLVFERFEFWYFFRRHYGSQRLSESHLHLFFQPAGQSRFRMDIGIERVGITRFWSLFTRLDDLSVLAFNADFQLRGPLWVFVRTRYGYRDAGAADDGTRLFLVERRFEPTVGVRLSL